MKYISTRGQDGPLSFEEALLNGLARDGGLYLPVEWPAFSKAEISAMQGKSYIDIAGLIMSRFTEGELSKTRLHKWPALPIAALPTPKSRH